MSRVSKQPIAFLSYVRMDDIHENGRLTELRDRLSGEIRMQTGEAFEIFQDRKDIAWGQQWKQRIEESLDSVTFLIPVITPAFFRSQACREEMERFLAREQRLGRNDLILPLYYVNFPPLGDAKKIQSDPLAQVIAARQYADWRELRFEPFNTPLYRKSLANIAQNIVTALERTHAFPAVSTEKPPEESADFDPVDIADPVTMSAASQESSSPPRHLLWTREGEMAARVFSGHTEMVTGVAISADGGCIVSGSADKRVRVWDVVSGKMLHDLSGHKGGISSVALSGCGDLIASCGYDGKIRLWDAINGKQLHELKGRGGGVTFVTMNADGSCVAWGSASNTLWLWNLKAGMMRAELRGHTDWTTSAALSMDEKLVVSGSRDGMLWVWDIASGECVRVMRGHSGEVRGVALSADGARMVSGSKDWSLGVWDVGSGKRVHSLRGHHAEVNGVALSTDGNLAVSCSEDKTVRVWNTLSGECVRILRGHFRSPTSVAISSDGSRIVSGGWDGVRVWDSPRGRCP